LIDLNIFRVYEVGVAYLGFMYRDGSTEFIQSWVYPEYIFIHPEYDCANGFNDISIYVLDTSVEFTGKRRNRLDFVRVIILRFVLQIQFLPLALIIMVLPRPPMRIATFI